MGQHPLANLARMSEMLLGAADEIRLAKRIEAGQMATYLLARGDWTLAGRDELRTVQREGREAWQRFLLANVRLVQAIAHYEARRCDVNVDELFQEGFLGLAEALRRWDHAAGYRFSTYAMQWVRRRVLNASVDYGVPGSARTVLRARRLRALVDELTAQLQRSVTDAEIAEVVGRSPAWVSRMRHLVPYAPLEPDLVADAGHEEESDEQVEAQVFGLLPELPEREREVVHVRFGLDRPGPLRQRDAASTLGMSLSTLRRHEARALRRLRGWLLADRAA